MNKQITPPLVGQRVTIEDTYFDGSTHHPFPRPITASGTVIECSGGTALVRHTLYGKIEIDEYSVSDGRNTWEYGTDRIRGWQ